MKILHINSAYGRGGAAQSLKDIHYSLLSINGVSSRLLVGDNYKGSDNLVVSLNNIFKRHLNVFITRFTGLDSIIYPFGDEKKIAEQILDADVINIHNLHGYFFMLRYLRFLKNKPVVWTIRDYWLLTGRCANFCECMRWQEGCGKCPHLDVYPKSSFLDFSRYMLKKKKHYVGLLDNLVLVPISNTVNGFIKKSYLKRIRSVVIYNGLERPKIFNKVKTSNKNVISYCVSKDKTKRLDDFINILISLPDKDKYQINLFGSKLPGRYSKILKDSKINFTEYKYIEDNVLLSKLYTDSDLYITTSFDESFGRTSIEAMMCGSNVMAYDIPIMREILGEYGFFVEKGDLKAFRDSIVEFFKRKRAHSSEKLKAYSSKFSKEKMIQSYYELYSKILKKR